MKDDVSAEMHCITKYTSMIEYINYRRSTSPCVHLYRNATQGSHLLV